MDNQHVLLLAAGCVLLYFLWLNCSESFVDEGFRSVKQTAKRAGNAAASGGKAVRNAAKKGVKGVGKALGGGKKKRPRGDMTGLTFVCKAVDFGSIGGAHAGQMIGPMAPNKGGKGGKGVKAGHGAGKDRRGPRNTPTTGLVAERNLKPSKSRGTR